MAAAPFPPQRFPLARRNPQFSPCPSCLSSTGTEGYRGTWRGNTPLFGGESGGPDETDRVARRVRPAGDLVRGVALDRLDLPVREHVLDDADVLVEDDQVAGLRHVAGAGRTRAPAALGPGVERVYGAEALAVVADRHPGLPARPRREVSAPRAGAGGPRRGRAVLGDSRRVVRAGRLLGLPHLAGRRGDDRGSGSRAARDGSDRTGGADGARAHRVREHARERRVATGGG